MLYVPALRFLSVSGVVPIYSPSIFTAASVGVLVMEIVLVVTFGGFTGCVWLRVVVVRRVVRVVVVVVVVLRRISPSCACTVSDVSSITAVRSSSLNVSVVFIIVFLLPFQGVFSYLNIRKLTFGRICNPSALSMSICNATYTFFIISHQRCLYSLQADFKSA